MQRSAVQRGEKGTMKTLKLKEKSPDSEWKLNEGLRRAMEDLAQEALEDLRVQMNRNIFLDLPEKSK